MELPYDIWDKIVKNSKGSIDEQIEKLDIEGIDSLIKKLTLKRNNMLKIKKSKFQFGDIVRVEGLNMLKVVVGFTNDCLRLKKVVPSDELTGFGYYNQLYEGERDYAVLTKLDCVEIFESRKDILKNMDTQLNDLMSGDEIKYCTKVYHERSNIFKCFQYHRAEIYSFNNKYVEIKYLEKPENDLSLFARVPRDSILVDL
jgi:hypothetical protein